MFKTIKIIVMAALCLFFKANGQNPTTIKPLNIGDKIPDELWNMPLKVVNHPEGKETITLNEYKGKRIILDFWATWCSGCIETMPATHKIENQFKNDIVIIGVTNENIGKVSSFTNQNKILKMVKPFSIVSDSSLIKFFPYRLIPNYVWIQKDGLVKAVTDAQELTEENIKALIQKPSTSLAQRKEVDANRPLFLDENISPDKILHYSILKKGVSPGLGGGTQTRETNGTVYRRLFYNTTILNMYNVTAVELFKSLGKGKFNRNRLIIETTQKQLILNEPDDVNRPNWEETHLYSYDIIVPLNQASHLYTYLLDDLNRSFSLHGRIERRNISCLLLVKKNDKLPIIGSEETTAKSINRFTALLNAKDFIHFPVLNETGITDKIRLKKTSANTMEQLLKELRETGLDLVSGIKPIDVFVIGDYK